MVPGKGSGLNVCQFGLSGWRRHEEALEIRSVRLPPWLSLSVKHFSAFLFELLPVRNGIPHWCTSSVPGRSRPRAAAWYGSDAASASEQSTERRGGGADRGCLHSERVVLREQPQVFATQF